jgi:hypothetical protein
MILSLSSVMKALNVLQAFAENLAEPFLENVQRLIDQIAQKAEKKLEGVRFKA